MTINGTSGAVIAKVTSQQPQLRQLAGAYDLVFPLIATRSAYLDPERHAVRHRSFFGFFERSRVAS